MNNEQVPPGTPNEEKETNTPPPPPKEPAVGEKETNTPPPPPVQEEPTTGGTDIGDHKTLAIIGYIIPILFFIPLISEAKNNKFAKYHANQQLNLLLFIVIGHAVASALIFLVIGLFLLPVVNVGSIILIIIGVINAVNGEMKPLPVIGNIQLLK